MTKDRKIAAQKAEVEEMKSLDKAEYDNELDAMVFLGRFVQTFESRFLAVRKGDCAIAVTGEPYIEFCSGLEPGEQTNRYRCCFLTPRYAVDDWIASVERYAAGKDHGVLYWRTRPEVSSLVFQSKEEMHDEIRVWRVYGRLLIADGPTSRDGAALAVAAQ